jgi:hypothetical protein
MKPYIAHRAPQWQLAVAVLASALYKAIIIMGPKKLWASGT